jgi:hypothetical protein
MGGRSSKILPTFDDICASEKSVTPELQEPVPKPPAMQYVHDDEKFMDVYYKGDKTIIQKLKKSRANKEFTDALMDRKYTFFASENVLRVPVSLPTWG